MLKKLLLGVCLCAMLAWGADGEATPKPGRKLWWASLAVLGAGTSMDLASSWGLREANPLLQSSDGRFGARGAAIKLGLAGVAGTVQWLITRRHPERSKPLAITNFVMGGAFGAVAARNFRLR